MLTTIQNCFIDRRTTFLVVSIAVAVMGSILLVTETTRPAATALVATGGVAWALVNFFEGRRSLRQQAGKVRARTDAVPIPEDIDRPDTWRRRALTHLGTWLQAVLLVWAVAFVIVLLGIPVALIGRGVIELVSWIAGALR